MFDRIVNVPLDAFSKRDLMNQYAFKSLTKQPIHILQNVCNKTGYKKATC